MANLFALADLVDPGHLVRRGGDVAPGVSSGFGSKLGGTNTRRPRHNGIDLRIPRGTPLFLPRHAKLAWTIRDTRNGVAVGFRVGTRHRLSIAHLCALAPRVREVGDLPRSKRQLRSFMRGELIGWSGDTGNSTGPHAHIVVAVYEDADGDGAPDDVLAIDPLGVIDWDR